MKAYDGKKHTTLGHAFRTEDEFSRKMIELLMEGRVSKRFQPFSYLTLGGNHVWTSINSWEGLRLSGSTVPLSLLVLYNLNQICMYIYDFTKLKLQLPSRASNYY
jgi:hypothetical protein